MTYSIPASEYTNYEELKQRALGNEGGFVKVADLSEYEQQELPFY